MRPLAICVERSDWYLKFERYLFDFSSINANNIHYAMKSTQPIPV